MGIPVETLGLLYYAVIVVGYTLFAVTSGFAYPSIVFFILVLTIIAFLFSLYLTFIQLFALKQWCSWCFVSAGICTVIFITALRISEVGFLSLLANYSNFIFIAQGIIIQDSDDSLAEMVSTAMTKIAILMSKIMPLTLLIRLGNLLPFPALEELAVQ